MTDNRHLYFQTHIGREKMIRQGSEKECPFCNREELTDILAEEGSLILVKNKYATLAKTFQTVLIETDDCTATMATYDLGHMEKIISFAIDQ